MKMLLGGGTRSGYEAISTWWIGKREFAGRVRESKFAGADAQRRPVFGKASADEKRGSTGRTAGRAGALFFGQASAASWQDHRTSPPQGKPKYVSAYL